MNNKITTDNYYWLLGRTIMICQCIEYDIKLIYAGMKAGSFGQNYIDIKKANLGDALRELKKLDRSDSTFDLSEGDYDLLNKVRKIRNYYVHESCLTFAYSTNHNDLLKSYQKLENESNRLYNLHKSIEKVRLDILSRYGRI